MSIKRKLDSLLRVSECLSILVSVEGLEEEHDKLRGKNTFKKIMANVNLLLDLQKQGIYKGYVSIASVFSDDLIPKLYDFL
jgi:sulfatase maturation enzyme AslB (radical SAM superfamily)